MSEHIWEVSLAETPSEGRCFETGREPIEPDLRRVTVKVRTVDAGRDVRLTTYHLWRDGVRVYSAPLDTPEWFAYKAPLPRRVASIVGELVSTMTIVVPRDAFREQDR